MDACRLETWARTGSKGMYKGESDAGSHMICKYMVSGSSRPSVQLKKILVPSDDCVGILSTRATEGEGIDDNQKLYETLVVKIKRARS